MVGQTPGRFSWLRVTCADAAYAGRLVEWVWATGGWLLNVARRRPESHRFEVLPRRCVVQRSPALLSRRQRLGRDYEELLETGETWVHTRNATGGPNLTEFPF